jgi:DNA polymerase beta
METLTLKHCKQLLKHPNINPLTGHSIKVGGPTFLNLMEKCDELKRKQQAPIRHIDTINTNNLKSLILSELDTLRKEEIANKNTFKVRAYTKVIKGIQLIDYPITTYKDVQHVEGIGSKIESKIKEIIREGQLFRAAEIRAHPRSSALEELMTVHGIGPSKAKELYKQGIYSIADLKREINNTPDLLNQTQHIGLQYLEDLSQRIPREEMDQYRKILEKVTQGTPFIFDIVGSYRRGADSSGDIDVMMTLPLSVKPAAQVSEFYNLVQLLEDKAILVASFAYGSTKYMGVAKLPNHPARHLDLTLYSRDVYPFALLHWTGSREFNIRLRKIALEKGYSLSEYGLSSTKGRVPKLETEHQILEFLLGYYVEPKDRI